MEQLENVGPLVVHAAYIWMKETSEPSDLMCLYFQVTLTYASGHQRKLDFDYLVVGRLNCHSVGNDTVIYPIEHIYDHGSDKKNTIKNIKLTLH